MFSRSLPLSALALLLLQFVLPLCVFAQNQAFQGFVHINVIQVDGESESLSYLDYEATLMDGRSLPLRFIGVEPSAFRTGDLVFLEAALVTDQQGAAQVLFDPSQGHSLFPVLAQVESEAAQLGTRSVIVIRVGFSDASVPCATNTVRGLMYTNSQSVQGLYTESSFSQFTINGDIGSDGTYDMYDVSLPYPVGSSCNYSTWASDADSAVSALGVTLSNYQHKVYVLPSISACGWAGLGTVGCSSGCRVWVNGNACSLADVYAHELGHNLGMQHSGVYGGSGNEASYGDRSCIMGYGGIGWRHWNAIHKAEMGWISSARVQTVSVDGTYQIALSDEDPSVVSPSLPTDIQLLKIIQPTAPANSYFVSFRYPAGSYSTNLTSAYSYKTNIHRANSSIVGLVQFHQALSDGQTFTDSANNISVTQLSTSGKYANVQVVVGNSNTPTPTVAPSSTSTPTRTPTSTFTRTATPTASATQTSSVTSTPSAVPTNTPTRTATPLVTASFTATRTATATATRTRTPSASPGATQIPDPSPTATIASPGGGGEASPSPTPSATTIAAPKYTPSIKMVARKIKGKASLVCEPSMDGSSETSFLVRIYRLTPKTAAAKLRSTRKLKLAEYQQKFVKTVNMDSYGRCLLSGIRPGLYLGRVLGYNGIRSKVVRVR